MNTKAIIRTILLFPVMGILISSCSSGSGSKESNGEDQRVEAVRVFEITSSEIARSVTYSAQLQAHREVHMTSASPGRISRIHVEPGQKVMQGQLLVEMDQTQLRQAMLQLQSLELDYRRLDTLRRVGSVSQQQYDQVKTQYDLAKSNVEFLQENTRLLAPFSGTISGKYFENGEMFSGAPNTPAGKAAIVSLVQTARLKALVNVAERYYPYVERGMEVSFSSDMYPGETFTGWIATIYPTIDPLTRTFKIEVALPNANERLRPGMFARASMELDQVEAFVVPVLAVMKLQGSNERYVFLEENGMARRVVVEMGDRFDDMVELVSDEIHKGDRLIIAGQARLLDGMEVQVVR
jgi:membrane fusion protein, multidrug efflux system